MAPIAGFLRMSEKSRRMNSKGKEQFRFVPISSSEVRRRYPGFSPTETTILVTSAAASDKKRVQHRADSHMPDLYVLAEILESECKDNSWVAQIVEIIGQSDDLPSCATILMYHRSLTEDNQPLQPRPKREGAASNSQASGAKKTVFTKTEPVAPMVCEASRVDLRETDGAKISKYTIFSVDPPDCLDIDDAVHIRQHTPEEVQILLPQIVTAMNWQGRSEEDQQAALAEWTFYEVGVHIADVTNYIKQLPTPPPTTTTAADITATTSTAKKASTEKVRRSIPEEALHRSFTVYLPHQQIPILPTFLSHDECSLKPGVDRPAMSCMMTIACDNSGAPFRRHNGRPSFVMVKTDFQRSLIRTAGAYSYEQVDSFLDNLTAAAGLGGSGDGGAGAAGKIGIATEHKVNEQDASGRRAASKSSVEQSNHPHATGGNLSGKAPSSAVKYSLKLLRKVFPGLNSHEIVEQLMLLANTCAAEFLERQSVQAASQSTAALGRAVPEFAYLLRRQLPARFVPTAEPSLETLSVSESAAPAGEAGAGVVVASRRPQDAFRGVPVDFTANPAEYLYCPVTAATTTGNVQDAAVVSTSAPTSSDEASTSSEPVKSSAVLSAVEKAHVSLGVPLYTHFTSPIRRYADQIVHALINHYLSAALPAPAAAEGPDPWIASFTPATVAHINLKQKQHKKFSRDMTIIDFVFDQCAAAGRNEVTLEAEAVVLPFRFSDKYKAYKTDLYVFAPCEFVYPVRLHTAAQAQLFNITYTDTAVLLQSRQTKEIKRLQVGDRIAVQVHCSKSAPTIRKKCVVSSPSITFSS